MLTLCEQNVRVPLIPADRPRLPQSEERWRIVRPSALAVSRLIVSSYRVAYSTGKSAGLAPLRILLT
jgi:hypothetical protein